MRLIQHALKALAWLLGGLLLIVAAWALSNSPLADSRPQPRPVALAEVPMTVPQVRNAYFALIALAGEADPKGKEWHCDPEAGCDDAWLRRAPALRATAAQHRAFGERCEAIVGASDFAFEEPPLPLSDVGPDAATPPRIGSALLGCVQWLRIQANLAVDSRDDARALATLTAADKLARAIATRNRSLIAHVLGWAALRGNWQLIDAVAAARPELAPRLLPLVRPLDPAILSAQRWIVAESAFGQALVHEMKPACGREDAGAWNAGVVGNWLWCAAGVGLLPNQTAQDADRFWVELLEATRPGLPTALCNGALRVEPSFSWRNTIGRAAFDIGASHFPNYIARQADTDLHRLVVELGLSMRIERMSGAQRAAWLQAQNIDPALRSRISLTDDALEAKPWVADQQTKLRPRDRIHVSLTGA